MTVNQILPKSRKENTMIDFVTAYLHDEKCGGHQFREEPEMIQPSIGQVYKVIYYCDNFHPDNHFVTVTPENISQITRAMNDSMNDICEYKKMTRRPGGRRI
jgi:hypothetical protein